MKFVLDTNILLYAANRDCQEHARAREYLEDLLNGTIPFCLTWIVCYEFLRVSTHPRIFPRPLGAHESLEFLRSIVAQPHVGLLVPTDQHFDTLAELIPGLPQPAGNFFYDIGNAVLAREYGIRQIVTADSDYHRFDFLRVTDPVHGTVS